MLKVLKEQIFMLLLFIIIKPWPLLVSFSTLIQFNRESVGVHPKIGGF